MLYFPFSEATPIYPDDANREATAKELFLDGPIIIKVLAVKGNQIKMGCFASPRIAIMRAEISKWSRVSEGEEPDMRTMLNTFDGALVLLQAAKSLARDRNFAKSLKNLAGVKNVIRVIETMIAKALVS